jgi:hypothetical protein
VVFKLLFEHGLLLFLQLFFVLQSKRLPRGGRGMVFYHQPLLFSRLLPLRKWFRRKLFV